MAPHPSDGEALRERLAQVAWRVADAARSAGRDPAEITTIVVTKFHPASLVRDLAALGVRDVGESRLQELAPKAAELADLDLAWHFIGQLQSKKASAVRDVARTIHALDRDSLLQRLSADGRPTTAFIQVNLTNDPARGGVSEAQLPGFVARVLETPSIRLAGLMAVAGLGREPRGEFARVRELRDRVVLPLAPSAVGLSMGMSGDFEAAIAEGATHLRIGTAITGMRPDPAYSAR